MAKGLNNMVGVDVIVRTFSAGVWFGRLEQKAGKEVILRDARRLWYWKTKQGISLSEIALYGVDRGQSRICEAVPLVWMEAIELIPVSEQAGESLRGAPNAVAE